MRFYMSAAVNAKVVVVLLEDRFGPSAMPQVTPMRLLHTPEPLDHPDFIFEPKLDGFRALAHVRGHRCELVSRNGHTFKQPS